MKKAMLLFLPAAFAGAMSFAALAANSGGPINSGANGLGGYSASSNLPLAPGARWPQSPKTQELLQLREEGQDLRDADGGKLTPEHYAYLQTKLDAIQAKYQ